MPSPISRRPSGLLDLLLTQQQGKNPAEILDSVQPVMDLFPFYASARLTSARATYTATGTGILAADSLAVPDGETWAVLNVSQHWEFALSSDDIKSNILLLNLQDASNVPLSTYEYFNPSVANEVMEKTLWFPQPMFLSSGMAFATQIGWFDQASTNGYLTALYYRMSV